MILREEPPSNDLPNHALVIASAILFLGGVSILGGFYWTWITAEEVRLSETTDVTYTSIGRLSLKVTPESSIFLVVISTAAVGSFVHTATSFVSYVGNRTMRYSWLAWYAFRTLVGPALAVVAYVVIRAGFISGTTGAENVNIFGVAAFAGLTGLFSKQATDKLREVFDTIFTGSGDNARSDKLRSS